MKTSRLLSAGLVVAAASIVFTLAPAPGDTGWTPPASAHAAHHDTVAQRA